MQRKEYIFLVSFISLLFKIKKEDLLMRRVISSPAQYTLLYHYLQLEK
jgi:hypothetical protein